MRNGAHPDASAPTPGIHLVKHDDAPAKRSLVGGLVRVFWGLVCVAGIVMFIHEALNGWPTVLRRRQLEVPAAVVYGIFTVSGLWGLFGSDDEDSSGYRWWSLVEYLDEPDGLRLFVGHLGADHPGLLVRPGETIEVHAEPGPAVRGGNERLCDCRIVAPSGMMQFSGPEHMSELTLEPLEQRAAAMGIAITTHGQATAIQHVRTTA